jgi:hypothetical protein
VFRCGGADGSAMSDCYSAWLEMQHRKQGIVGRGLLVEIHDSPNVQIRPRGSECHTGGCLADMFANKVHAAQNLKRLCLVANMLMQGCHTMLLVSSSRYETNG